MKGLMGEQNNFLHLSWFSAALLKREQQSFHHEPDNSTNAQEFCSSPHNCPMENIRIAIATITTLF